MTALPVQLALLVALAAPPAATVAIVAFDSPEGIQRLERSTAKADFFALAPQFETQEHGGNCGPASATVVLNALRVPTASPLLPKDASPVPAEVLARLPKGFDPIFARYTQKALLESDAFQKVKTTAQFQGQPMTPGGKPDPGIQLRQLHRVLEGLGAKSEIVVVDDKADAAAIKQQIVDNLKRASDFVVVNYHRKSVGQEGGGHISPLGAYDEASDSFLVLDTNASKGKAYAWVPAAALVAAMRTKDTIENRGFLLVREGA